MIMQQKNTHNEKICIHAVSNTNAIVPNTNSLHVYQNQESR